jgi:hypothetical protein
MDVVEIECEDGGWIQMAQFRAEWPPVVETAINLKVPSKTVTVPRAEPPSAFQECLLWVELISHNQRKLRFESC